MAEGLDISGGGALNGERDDDEMRDVHVLWRLYIIV